MVKKVDLNEIEEVDDTVVSTEPPTPRIGDVKWTEYVLSLLTDKEKDGGNPKVDGLRRIIEVVFGEVIDSYPNTMQSPTKENGYTAVVEHILVVERNGRHEKYGGVADAGLHNTDAPYSKFPAAVAETRAEGRALRRALRLAVVTAEELSQIDAPLPVSMTGIDMINTTQIQMINSVCKRCDINVTKLLTSLFGEAYNIGSITSENARTVIKSLQEYQQNLDKIPAEIKGFGDTK